MAEASTQGNDPASGFRCDPWNDRGEARLTAFGDDPRAVVSAALAGVLALALDGTPEPPEGDGTAAVPIAGQGADLASVVARLADDLLARLEAFGGGFRHVRLDGLLQTDAGGYSGWGYAIGRADGPAIPGITLAAEPATERDPAGRLAVRVALRRG